MPIVTKRLKADDLNRDRFTPDGGIYGLTKDGDYLYLAGEFESIGTKASGVTAVSETTGVRESTNPLSNIHVMWDYDFSGDGLQCIHKLSDGRWLLGGDFTGVQGSDGVMVAVSNLALINTDGTVNRNFSLNPNSTVTDIVEGDQLYIIGSFSTIGGKTRQQLCTISIGGDGTASVGLLRITVGGGSILCGAPAGAGIVIGGTFTSINDTQRFRMARVGSGGLLDATFDPSVIGGQVNVIIEGAGGWFIGGNFSSVTGGAQSKIAFVDTSGNGTLYNNGNVINNQVLDLCLLNGELYAVGSFTTFNVTTTRNRALALDGVDATLLPWDPNVTGSPSRIVTSNGRLYLAGLTAVGGTTRTGIACVNASDGGLESWDPHPGDLRAGVRDIFIESNVVYMAGAFITINATRQPYIARVNALTGELDTTFAPPALDGQVLRIVVYDGAGSPATSGKTLYIGGYFTAVGGTTRNFVAALDAADGSLVVGWDPDAGSWVKNICIDNSHVYISGEFTTIGVESRNRCAAVHVTNAALNGWYPSGGMDDWVLDMVIAGNRVFFGGDFGATAGGAAFLAAAPKTLGSTSWDSFNIPVSGSRVVALDVNQAQDRLYVYGFGTTIGGQNRGFAAEINLTTDTVTSWAPSVNSAFIGRGRLSPDETTVFMMNDPSGFDLSTPDTIGGQDRTWYSEVSTSTGLATTWAPVAMYAYCNSFFGEIIITDDAVYYGAVDLQDANGNVRPFLVQFLFAPSLNLAGVEPDTGDQKLLGIGDIAVSSQGAALFGPTGVGGTTGISPRGASPVGVQGLSIRGGTGVDGATGLWGLTGFHPTGILGITGVEGETGLMGITGALPQGFQGGTGLEGITGVDGMTGLNLQGRTGLIGITGFSPTGITPQGATGLQGHTGVVGTGAFATINSNASLDSSNYIVGVQTSNGPITVTLPTAASVGPGKMFLVQDIDGQAGTNNITVTRSDSDTINGQASIFLTSNYEQLKLYSNGISRYGAQVLSAGVRGITGVEFV